MYPLTSSELKFKGVMFKLFFCFRMPNSVGRVPHPQHPQVPQVSANDVRYFVVQLVESWNRMPASTQLWPVQPIFYHVKGILCFYYFGGFYFVSLPFFFFYIYFKSVYLYA